MAKSKVGQAKTAQGKINKQKGLTPAKGKSKLKDGIYVNLYPWEKRDILATGGGYVTAPKIREEIREAIRMVLERNSPDKNYGDVWELY